MSQPLAPPTSSRAPSVRTEDRKPEVSGSELPIAIVGMACQFPDAYGIPAFWRLLEDGMNAEQESEHLLVARPAGNLRPTAIEQQIDLMLPVLPRLRAVLESIAHGRADAELATRERVRTALGVKERVAIEPVLPYLLCTRVLSPLLPVVREPI